MHVHGNGPASRAGFGPGRCSAGPTWRKRPGKIFPILNSLFFFDFQAGGIIIRKKYVGTSENVKFCMDVDENFLHNFCIGHLDQRTTIFK
jgi:hypothetical protein